MESVRFLRADDLVDLLNEHLPNARGIYIAVAYLTSIPSPVEKFLRSLGRRKFRLVVGLSPQCITDPDIVETLLHLRDLKSKQIELKFIDDWGFHPKLIIILEKGRAAVIVGSSNLTSGGFAEGMGNIEANIVMNGRHNRPGPVKDAFLYFKSIRKIAHPIEQPDLDDYRRSYDERHPQGTGKNRGRPKARIPRGFVTRRPKHRGRLFTIILDGKQRRIRRVTVTCMAKGCNNEVVVPRAWATNWHCITCSGDTYTYQNPDRVKNRALVNRLKERPSALVLDGVEEVRPDRIQVTCATKKHHDKRMSVSNDFYYMICKSHYKKWGKSSTHTVHGLGLGLPKEMVVRAAK